MSIDNPGQQKLFEVVTRYTVVCVDEPSGVVLWQALDGANGPLTYEQAVTTVHQMAEVMAAGGTDFTGNISPEGRMYGTRDGTQVVIQINTEDTYIYP